MKHRTFDYQVGQQVLVLNSKEQPGKLEPQTTEGPFTILQVHVNGTVTIKRDAFTTERINMHPSITSTSLRFYAYGFPQFDFFPTKVFWRFFMPYGIGVQCAILHTGT